MAQTYMPRATRGRDDVEITYRVPSDRWRRFKFGMITVLAFLGLTGGAAYLVVSQATAHAQPQQQQPLPLPH
jgi:hypothetical protein